MHLGSFASLCLGLLNLAKHIRGEAFGKEGGVGWLLLRNESVYTSTHIIKPGLRAVAVGDLFRERESARGRASMHREKTEAGQHLTCEYHLAELLQDPESCPPRDYMIYLHFCYASYSFRLTLACPMAPFPMLMLPGQISMTTP